MLASCLIEILDVLCHDRRGNGFPCFLDDKALPVLLDTHLLREHVHDDEHDNGEKHGVILDLVNLEDDELLVEESAVHVVVECVFQLTAFIERSKDCGEVINRKGDIVFLRYLRYALDGKLIEGVEIKFLDFDGLALMLNLLDFLFYSHHVLTLKKFRSESL